MRSNASLFRRYAAAEAAMLNGAMTQLAAAEAAQLNDPNVARVLVASAGGSRLVRPVPMAAPLMASLADRMAA